MNNLHSVARRTLPLVDLTCLNETDSQQTISALCDKAQTPWGPVAAICIYPLWLKHARTRLDAVPGNQVRLATVVNFPHGDLSLHQIEIQIGQSLAAGADEIDLVMPYRQLQGGEVGSVARLLKSCRRWCHKAVLKVILETGELEHSGLISQAAALAIDCGADFIKTSTGKAPVNATLDAARLMLEQIHRLNPAVGFKAAGGIRTLEQAAGYLSLADELMGACWISPSHFRFGASGLLDSLMAELSGTNSTATQDQGY
ncbi:deoxyribose-phosphate aldolase [Bowmanella dokdonensis]|uniref:Deoxyribose-phosphate aldolase n=1 Tax=Bowmanella dokdonensis TaxID=751969 RepID=A0A939DJZ2_9ALTE|nr:deoxyribose-phosphate aldolase [Bowmanella dokdonensis]MBN7824134.1 deoxyribose-phosphate aldolase [Bowmanella dokdonensis]